MAEMSVAEKAQRALDYMEIQNALAAHVYYYCAQRQWEELETVWARKAPDITYAHNERAFVGQEAVRKYYGENNDRMRQQKLEMMSRLFPDIKNVKDNDGVGDLVVHLLTTPYIEIARDGKTAKGVWYSPGLCSELGPDGQLVVVTIWERYGVDFIKEDGKWKIWHLRSYGDFMAPVDKSWVDGSRQFPGRTADGGPEPNREISHIEPYSVKRVAKFQPGLPEPYETWDDSMSYIQ